MIEQRDRECARDMLLAMGYPHLADLFKARGSTLDKSFSEAGAEKALVLLAAYRSQSPALEWCPPETVPDQAINSARFYNVAVIRRAVGKPFTFAAQYLRDFLLEYDDEGRSVTGWFCEDVDGYAPLIGEGDTLLGWAPIPQWPSAPQPPAARAPSHDDIPGRDRADREGAGCQFGGDRRMQ